MVWKNFVSALQSYRDGELLATAIVYGLSLAVRFTSATGEEMEIPAQSVQRTHPVMSIMTEVAPSSRTPDWARSAAQP